MTEGPAAVRFSDETLESITCESTWRRGHTDTCQSSTQTRDLVTCDVGEMSLESRDASTQTKLVSETMSQPGNMDEFVSCVRRAGDLMLDELCKNKSKAFDNYHVIWDDDLDSNARLLSMNEPGSEKYTAMPVAALAWNATGSVLAAGFGLTDHSDFCHHKSRICTWNIVRHEQRALRPDNALDVDGCVTCLGYHPTKPGVLAAGTFTGTVLMWDLAREQESSVLLSDTEQETRGDTVSHIEFLVEKRKSSILTVTVSGRVCIWVVAQKGQGLAVHASHVIQGPGSVKFGLKVGHAGVSSVATGSGDNTTFLLATETGRVYKCERSTDQVVARLAYTSHRGPVYGLHYSTLIRNVFATCGTEGTIHIYSVLQDTPVMTLEPCQGYLYSCRWSPVCPGLLAVGGSKGHVVFYNLDSHVSRGHVVPYHLLKCDDEQIVIRTVEFNTNQTNLLASGDNVGGVKVWRLGNDLSTPTSQATPILLTAPMAAD